MVIKAISGTSHPQGISQEVELGLTVKTCPYVVAHQSENLIQEVESGLTTPGLTIWANSGFFLWRSGLPQAHHQQPPPMDTKPSASLPSLKLMEAANRLLKKADAMDNSEIDKVMDSFPKADRDKRWEIIGLMFLLVVFHPATDAEVVYEQLKKLLMVARNR